jgi:hypothetical protein
VHRSASTRKLRATLQRKPKGAVIRIAVIGMGSVVRTLRQRWAELGHIVVFGAKHPEQRKAMVPVARSGDRAPLASVADASDAEVRRKLGRKFAFALPLQDCCGT